MVATTDEKTTKKTKMKDLSFEAAASELEEIVEKLENGSIDLDLAVDFYKRGIELKNHCEKILSDAKLKIEKIVQNEDGIELTNMEKPS